MLFLSYLLAVFFRIISAFVANKDIINHLSYTPTYVVVKHILRIDARKPMLIYGMHNAYHAAALFLIIISEAEGLTGMNNCH